MKRYSHNAHCWPGIGGPGRWITPSGSSCGFFITIIIVILLSVRAVPAAAEDRILSITLGGYPVEIQYLEEDQKVASRVAAICQEWLPDLAGEIGLEPINGFRIHLIADMAGFRERSGVRLPSWGIAFALMENQVMIVDVARATRAWNSLERVIPHEISHILLGQRVGGVDVPVWFVEGLAQWQANEWSLIESWRLMESVWGNHAPRLGQVTYVLPDDETRARHAYRVAYSGFTYRFDDDFRQLPGFLDEVVSAGSFSEAFARYWNEDEITFYARFDNALHKKYRSRLLVFQTGPLFTLLAVLFVFVYLRIKWRNRSKLRRMEMRERGFPHHDH
jgi:hypothetical protein